MNWITVLRNLYRQFPENNRSRSPFSKVEKFLKKKIGFARAVFALRHGKVLITTGVKSPFSGPDQKAVISHLNRTLKPWIRGRKRDDQWLGFWPVVVGKDWVGCFAMGSRHQGFSDEEKMLMELLADRTAFFLEEQRIWKCLERADRQSSMGFRSAAMIHEIRAPLTALSTLVQLLPEKKDDGRFMGSFQSLMLREINRLSGMTETFLDFTKFNSKGSGRIEFSQVVDQAVKLLSPLFEIKRVQLKVKNERDLFLKGDESQMESLILNLLQNALESVDSGGKVEISTALSSRPAHGLGPWITLRIKDNGKGISKDSLEKIFDPYFSTKGRGTGLGLAICQRVVENHRGSIKANSSIDGTVFQVFLPAARKP